MFFQSKLISIPSDGLRDISHSELLNFKADYLFEGTDGILNNNIHVELPYPMDAPFKSCGNNIVRKLVKTKQEYDKLRSKQEREYDSIKSSINKSVGDDSECLTLPRGLLELYATEQPVNGFDCDYNVYYTGGFLAHLKLYEHDYLVRPYADNYLCLTDFHEPTITHILPFKASTPIFNVNSVPKSNSGLLTIRQENIVSVVKLKRSIDLVEKWTKTSKRTVIDAKLSGNDVRQLGIINDNLKFSLYDIEAERSVRHSSKLENHQVETDVFQQFDFIDNNNILIIDRQVVRILDCRAKAEINLLNPELINCNSLCNFAVNNNSLHLASRHYLLNTDLRFLSELKYFSHVLKSAPCYMDLVSKNGDSYICLSSQDANENKVLFTGQSLYGLPYSVPRIQNTLKACRLKKDLLLMDHIDERLQFPTAGLKLVNIGQELFVCSANCLGEIFLQQVGEDPWETDQPVEAFYKWAVKLERPKSVVHATNIANLSAVRFALEVDPIESDSDAPNSDNVEKFLAAHNERYNIYNVAGFARNFLSLWLDEEEINYEEKADASQLPEVPASEKVHSWIQDQHFDDDDDEDKSFSTLNMSRELNG